MSLSERPLFFSICKASKVIFFVCLCIAATTVSAQQRDNPNVPRALDVQSLEPTEFEGLSHRRLLFATNRKVVVDTETLARSKRGGSIRYENIFTTTLDPSLAYGWVEVVYPTNREMGMQNYSPRSGEQNPFSYFSIKSFGVVGSRAAAHNLAITNKYSTAERALVHVHGINNSFRDGAERLTQLVVDLNVAGIPLFFSWPGDGEIVPLIGVSPDSYRRTLAVAKKSEPYLSQAIDDLLPLDAGQFDLLAHSMGTLLVFDMLKQRPVKGVGTFDPSKPPLLTLPNLVLAAPDIGLSEFASGREELVSKVRRLTIYCSQDRALFASRVVNGEERVGYCSDPKQRKDFMEGVEFVRVFGNFRDAASHSYYMNHPAIVSDIKRLLPAASVPSDFVNLVRMPYREIFLNY